MAEVNPLKLVDQGGGVGALAEFGAGDTLPKGALPALQVADVSGLGTAATRAALGTAGSLYGRDSILGTVSQSAGVPTGAIIERGINANGEYVRYADGTLICTFVFAVASGGSAWTYPSVFSADPIVVAVERDTAASRFICCGTGINSAVIRSFSHDGTNTGANAGCIAIGRWY